MDTSDEQRAERAAHTIYGSIIVLAVLVAEEGTAVSPGEAIASALAAALVTALAEIYANYVGATMRARRHLTSRERLLIGRTVAVGFAIAIVPVAFLIPAATGTIDPETALEVAIWTGVGIVGVHAAIASRLAGSSVARSALLGLGFAALGTLLVALKALV